MKEIKIDVGETFRLIVPDKCIEITYQGNDKLRITKVINKWKAEKRDGELKKEDGHVPLFVGVGASKAPRPILNLFKNKEV